MPEKRSCKNECRHGSQIWPQLTAASPTNRPQPEEIITYSLRRGRPQVERPKLRSNEAPVP